MGSKADQIMSPILDRATRDTNRNLISVVADQEGPFLDRTGFPPFPIAVIPILDGLWKPGRELDGHLDEGLSSRRRIGWPSPPGT